MTDVLIFKDAQNRIVGYRVSGHSGYADHGEDIVCSAISTLTQTAILALNRVCDIGEEYIDFKLKDGYLNLELSNNISREQREKADIVLETMMLGLESLMEEYSDYITLKSVEVN